MSDGAAKIPAGSEGLEWAPYLLGERTPHLDPEVRAAFAGIGVQHYGGAFCARRAGGRGAIRLQDYVYPLPRAGHSRHRAFAWAAAERAGALWRKIQAGIYGQAVEVLVAEEGGAFGCALMAGVGAGHWKNLDEACGQAIKVAERIEPDAAEVAAYKAGYAQVEKVVSSAARPKKLGFGGQRS